MADESEPVVASEPEADAPVGLVADERERLTKGAISARENNLSDKFMDAANRHWFVGCANVDNRAHVLIQVQRGLDIREEYLSTDTFTPDLVEQVITKLDGALS